ncbi:hypothetical protein KNO15_10710 [Leifsonia shinshuensis]|uniref:hypothetical protein n=1 Tax=Leifsonia shinshuensis TaxID=150026 RepID=UPI001F51430E|nr:hypothetical protein [Leifsonia shinshuensis]MCI0157165.1 hypothetical protein [Leifsonia shinshuensis]
MRIRDGSVKAASAIAGYALVAIAGFLIAMGLGPGWGAAAGSALIVALVIALTRVFRGEDESDEPRRWWRMTARPAAGFVLSGGFAAQAVGVAASSSVDQTPLVWLSVAVSILIAVAYLNSSVRLTAHFTRLTPTR